MRDINVSDEQDIGQLHLVEQGQRLSASALWRWQRQFFDEQSTEAWRQSIVPHYVTSNTFIAQAYAKVLFGYWRDLARDRRHPLDPQQPLHVLELGAGSGRFSYHFLKKFLPMLEQSTLGDLKIRYVMSDFTEKNLAFWKQHPFLQPYIAQGVLDFALVDLDDPQEIVLQHSGAKLGGAPLVVLANYVFDSIRQDAFYVDNGVLHESLLTLHSPQAEPDPHDAAILQRVQASFHNVPADAGYYPEPELNQLLAGYRDTLVDSHFLLPTQAIRYLQHLRRLSGSRMLLLSGDKGMGREEDLLLNGPPSVTSHGSISLMVNYHALGQYTEQQGGCTLSTPQPHRGLHICATLFDTEPLAPDSPHLTETRQAFTEHISQIGPDDFYVLKRVIQANAEQLKMHQLLAYLRLSGWDAANFLSCYQAIINAVEELDGAELPQVASMARQVWATYYPLGEKSDLAYLLGKLMYEINYFDEALTYLHHSRALYGDTPGTLHNIGMCYYNLRQLPRALDYVRQALRLDPAYQSSRIMLIEISGEMR